MTHPKFFSEKDTFRQSEQVIARFSITKKVVKFFIFICFSFLLMNVINAQMSPDFLLDTGLVCDNCSSELSDVGTESVSFYLHEATFAAIIFMDNNGKVIRTMRDEFDKGLHTIDLNEFKGKGLLNYTLEYRGFSETRTIDIH